MQLRLSIPSTWIKISPEVQSENIFKSIYNIHCAAMIVTQAAESTLLWSLKQCVCLLCKTVT